MTRDQVLEFVRQCGVDPNAVRTLKVDRTGVTFAVFRTDTDGHRYTDPDGRVALRRVRVPIDDDRTL